MKRKKLLIMRKLFKDKSYTTERGAMRAFDKVALVLDLPPAIYRVVSKGPKQFTLEIPCFI